MQNLRSKKWDLKGVITEIRLHPNGNPFSFVIKKKNGRSPIRHISHVQHDISVDEKSKPTCVSFCDKPSERHIPRLVITRSRAKELSERALNARSALKSGESSSDDEGDTESPDQWLSYLISLNTPTTTPVQSNK